MPVTAADSHWQSTVNGGWPYTATHTWHWFCGFSVIPGSDKSLAGAMPCIVWSPYPSDAEIFVDRDKAVACLEGFTDEFSGCKVMPINKSHLKEGWKTE